MGVRNKDAVFISYCRADCIFVDKLTADLKNAGIEIWRDTDEIHIGDYLLDRIADAIKTCHLFIAVVSTNYKDSTWCRHEVKLKLSEEASSGQIHVLPIRLDNTDPEDLLPAKGWADFRDEDQYDQSFTNLRVSISYHLDTRSEEDKRKKLENILKQQYVDACYGAAPKAEVLNRFHTAATMNPESIFLWRALGYIYHYHLGDFESAELYYKRALELDPNNASVVRALGMLHFHIGNREAAKPYLLRAQQLGYSTIDEWQEYADANVSYNHGPFGGGGIPNLFGATRADVDEYLDALSGKQEKNENQS